MPASWSGTPRDWDAGLLVTSSIANTEWRDRLMYLKDAPTIDGAPTITGVLTLTAAPVLSALTASLPVFTNGSKALVSNAMTGTGNVVMSASPTLPGTIGGASMTLSGTLGVTGAVTGGTYNSQTITSSAAFTGSISFVTLLQSTTSNSMGAAMSATEFRAGANSTLGAVIAGYGSTYDFAVLNKSVNTVLRVPTGTLTVQMLGAVEITGDTAITGVLTVGDNQANTAPDESALGILVTCTHAAFDGVVISGNTTRAANTAFDLLDLRSNSVSEFLVGGTGIVTMAGTCGVANATATPAGGSTGVRLTLGSTTGFGVYVGSGVPTVSAAQGSLYLRSDGSSTSTRAYINTDGGTTWTAITTAA